MVANKKLPCLKFIAVPLVFAFVAHIEAGCNLKLNYLCQDGKTCIPKSYVCNGYADCPGNDDERDCSLIKCSDTKKFFLCRDNVSCIGRNLICDNEPDCPDASDESDALCDEEGTAISTYMHKNVTCNLLHEFKCGNNVCIPLEEACNGAKNCIDGSDEDDKFCEHFHGKYKCPGFLCKNDNCLESMTYFCDGVDDCGDNSDEDHCSASCELKDGKFLCADGEECIDVHKVCDGVADCSDKSDEGSNCKVGKDKEDACKNLDCGTEGVCEFLPTGPTCICKKGFTKNPKTNRCEDIDECKIFGTCSQGCVNQNGSYYCTCAKGFVLNDDKKSCDTTTTNASITYTTKNFIKQLIFGQSNLFIHQIISKTKQSIGVAYDGESYYWTEVEMARESIVKYDPVKKSREVILTNGLELPEYITVDWLTKNIYFTDSMRKHVAVCTNNGIYCTELVKIDLMHYPRALALDPIKGLLFWSDWGNHSHIGVSFMDGSNAKILVDDVDWPNGLALDSPNARIYWIDALRNAIETVSITGEDRRVVLKDVFKHPFSLDVFGNNLYWSDHETMAIETCDKFTGKNHEIIIQGEEIFDVHIYDSSAMPYVRHGCEGNPCSHICLLRNDGNYSCACPIGMELNSDNHNCRFNSKSFMIHLGVGKNVLSRAFQSFGRNIDRSVKPTDVEIQKMEFNVLNGAIFYANNNENKLYILDTIGNSHILVSDPNMHVTSMSFDYLGNNLYWADNVKNTIEVLSLKTKKRAIVHHYTGDYIPTSIAVVPTLGEIFVALLSQRDSQINRVSMKGVSLDDSSYHVIKDGLGRGTKIYLTVDEECKKLYWSNTKNKRIEFASLDGTDRRLFIQSERNPGPLAIVDDYLHWTSENSKSLQWRRKNATGPVKLTRIDFPDLTYRRIIPIVTGNPIKINSHPCAVENGGCSDICVSDGLTKNVCLCGVGRVFLDKSQTKCIERTRCDARCGTGECIEAKMFCDGKVDCLDKSDEDDIKCKTQDCNISQFKCNSGQCIAKKLRCDKNVNCLDGSDEWNCPIDGKTQICNDLQVQCQNSTVCIYRNQICDLNPDCPDNSDETEESCNQKCLEDEFKCRSGQCIKKEFKCDHKIDCYDGSDEDEECSHMCQPSYKPCRNGYCIEERFFCNNIDDCEDGFDELNCSNSTKLLKCDDGKFQCPSDPSLCLEINRKCDKIPDCPKGEDERNCPRCRGYEFTCLNGHCIDGALKCDGKPDCTDNSDEQDCGNVTPPTICTSTNYRCSNGKCIDYNKVCDGIHDCDDDEGGQCSETCIRSKCDHYCNRTPKGIVCSCKEGYQLNPGTDNQCIDINECNNVANPICAQICYNIKGSYKCACHDEFILGPDGHECKAVGTPYKLIFADYSEIKQLDAKSRGLLHSVGYSISDMAVDARSKKLMYSIAGESGINVLDMETKNVEKFDGFPEALLMTYDWLVENLYVASRNAYNKVEIYACNMRNKKCVMIVRLKEPRLHLTAINVDPINKYLFVVKRVSRDTKKITTEITNMKLDGSDEKLIIRDPSLIDIRALSLDIRARVIYFTEQSTQSLIKIDYKGNNRVTLVHQSSMLMKPTVMDIFENHAYVLDESHGRINVCKLYQDNTCSLSINVATTKRFLIAHISKQIKGENKCNDHKCREICINGDFDKKCMCSNEKGEAEICNEENIPIRVHEEDSSSPIWIILLVIMLFGFIGGAGFVYFRRQGFNYDMNILNFHRNSRPKTVNEFAPVKLPFPGTSDEQHTLEATKPAVHFAMVKDKNYTEVINNDFSAHYMYPTNDLKNVNSFTLEDDVTGGDANSGDDDDDQQRLIL